MWLYLPGRPSPFLHNASDPKLELGKAWEQGYVITMYAALLLTLILFPDWGCCWRFRNLIITSSNLLYTVLLYPLSFSSSLFHNFLYSLYLLCLLVILSLSPLSSFSSHFFFPLLPVFSLSPYYCYQLLEAKFSCTCTYAYSHRTVQAEGADLWWTLYFKPKFLISDECMHCFNAADVWKDFVHNVLLNLLLVHDWCVLY